MMTSAHKRILPIKLAPEIIPTANPCAFKPSKDSQTESFQSISINERQEYSPFTGIRARGFPNALALGGKRAKPVNISF